MGSCKQGVSRTASGKIEIIHLQKVKFSEARIQVPRRQIVTLQRKGQLTGFWVKTGKMWQKTAICALLVSSVRGVSISKESSGSIIVQAGQELLIDCDFSFDKDEEEELVVKWFFNASTTPFYQWVPALDVGPQVHYYVYIWSSLCDKCWMVVEASLAKLSLHKRNVLTR